MRKMMLKAFAFLIPFKKLRKKVRKEIKRRKHPLVDTYLYGLSGIEIGGSGKSYGLDNQKGSYANVDIIDAETRAKKKGWSSSQLVNILAEGDNLPFKNEVFDYVFSSHVIEHFFDPIKAIEEWFRVLKKGGYIFMIIPHKERTFDRNRQITGFTELKERHNGKLTFSDYVKRNKNSKLKHETKEDKDHHRLIRNEKPPEGWERFSEYDFTHHWSVWDTNAFLNLCKEMNWNVAEYQDVEDGNDFTVILRK